LALLWPSLTTSWTSCERPWLAKVAPTGNSAYRRDWHSLGASLTPQCKVGLLASSACTFSTTCVFACVCSFRRSVVIRVRRAPSFDQHGLLASTACTFLRRLMFIMCGRFQKTCAPLRRNPFWVAWVVSWKLPAPLGRPGPQRHPKGTPGTGFGSSRVASWRPPGPLWEATRLPKAPQSRSMDGANVRPVTQNYPSATRTKSLHCVLCFGLHSLHCCALLCLALLGLLCFGLHCSCFA
jgi:hypothetical protein